MLRYSWEVVGLIEELGKKKKKHFLTGFDDMSYQCTSFLSDLCGRKHKRSDEIKTTHSSKTILLRNIIRNK